MRLCVRLAEQEGRIRSQIYSLRAGSDLRARRVRHPKPRPSRPFPHSWLAFPSAAAAGYRDQRAFLMSYILLPLHCAKQLRERR